MKKSLATQRTTFCFPNFCFSFSCFLLFAFPISAQEALRNSLAGDAAYEAARLHPESMPYTVKSGDFRLLATPSFGLDYNDNVRLSKDNPEDDFILRPAVGLIASYPVTQRNLLQLNVTVGYDAYMNHSDLSRLDISSGSALSFDIYIKDWLINLHDRFSYVQDSATEAAVANTASYGSFQNTAGLSGNWDLEDITVTLGYDHRNYLATSSQFEYTDNSSDNFLARAGLKLTPRLTAGLEATAAPTTYDQHILNDNVNYSLGAYADWKPGNALHVQPRIGYTIFSMQQTSLVMPATDQNSWYADITVNHPITESVSYSLSLGHELRLGVQSDTIDDTYARGNATWNLIRHYPLNTSLTYEHGTQGAGVNTQGAGVNNIQAENYDQFGVGLGVSHPITKRLTASLNYRLTLRSSDIPNRDYTQNLVSILLSYHQ